MQFSRPLAMVAGQSLVNVLLAVWLYVEYAHNAFGQQYLSSFWASNFPTISVAAVLAGVIAGGSYLALSRRGWTNGSPMAFADSSVTGGLIPAKMKVLDDCPVCNIPLKALSENRLQCRRCHRYFKK